MEAAEGGPEVVELLDSSDDDRARPASTAAHPSATVNPGGAAAAAAAGSSRPSPGFGFGATSRPGSGAAAAAAAAGSSRPSPGFGFGATSRPGSSSRPSSGRPSSAAGPSGNSSWATSSAPDGPEDDKDEYAELAESLQTARGGPVSRTADALHGTHQQRKALHAHLAPGLADTKRVWGENWHKDTMFGCVRDNKYYPPDRIVTEGGKPETMAYLQAFADEIVPELEQCWNQPLPDKEEHTAHVVANIIAPIQEMLQHLGWRMPLWLGDAAARELEVQKGFDTEGARKREPLVVMRPRSDGNSMQTPAPLAGPPDLQVSEAATPGASVAAVRGEHDHVLEAPEFDTPGQASPARHRSNEGGRSLADGAQLDSSRSRSAGLHAAAAALAEVAAAPAAAAAEPLSKPRLRVQGADIILEDAASPKDAAENGGGAAHRPPQERAQQQQLAMGTAAAAGGAGAGTSAAAQQPAAVPTQQQQQQQQQQAQPPQQHVPPPPLNLAAAMRVSQTHEHELQLRLASRTATGVSNMAIASTRPPATHPLPQGEDSRLRGHDAGGGGGEAGPASGSSSAVEGPVRIKYRSTLTEENVAYLNKLDQYASRPDTTGRSSERIWRWLEGSGPPFDNPPPSLGVPTVSKSNLAAASRRQGAKRSFFSCFNCFGGGATR